MAHNDERRLTSGAALGQRVLCVNGRFCTTPPHSTSGRVLAANDPYGSYAPASTIKVLLAMTVLDNLRPDNFARANASVLRRTVDA